MEPYINQVLREIGVSPSDVIMIHGDAGVAVQLTDVEMKDRLNFLISQLISFIGTNGTLVVPTFSYTFTKNKIFDVNKTSSDIGVFSEAFRDYPGTLRSKNPNFSVSSIGKHKQQFAGSRIDDCFGSDTAFDLLYKYNAKIVCLGCDFSRITFVHYVEQSLGVSYRYLKSFSGEVIDDKKVQRLTNTYYVRDLNINSQGELSAVKQRAIYRGVLSRGKYGRFPVLSISSQDFYSVAKELLVEDSYALTQHRLDLKSASMKKKNKP